MYQLKSMVVGKQIQIYPFLSFVRRMLEKKKENSSHHYIIKNVGSNIRIKDTLSQGSWQPDMDICRYMFLIPICTQTGENFATSQHQ